MTVVTRMQRKSRLSQIIDTAGGLSVRAALDGARKRLAALEPRASERIDALVAELAALPAPVAVDDRLPRREQAYRLATDVIDAAAMFDKGDLCAAARNLCDLIDAADDGFDWRVVPVHAQAMAIMASAPAGQRQALLDHLRSLRANTRRTGA